jgi:hypothetical protein
MIQDYMAGILITIIILVFGVWAYVLFQHYTHKPNNSHSKCKSIEVELEATNT